MTALDLISSGLCDDLAEVFEQYPLEFLDDFGGLRQVLGVPAERDDRLGGWFNGPCWPEELVCR